LVVKPQIAIEDFGKLDLRVGEVMEVSPVPGSEKLVKLFVNFKDFTRTIYAGLKKWYLPQSLVGRKLIFVVNLEPRTFKINDLEYTSEGMIMAAGDREAILYNFDKDIENGTTIH